MNNEETQVISETEPIKRKKKKKRKFIPILVIFLVAVAALSGFYMYERYQPQKALTAYLNYAKDMNFDGMSSLLKNNDLSALDEAYVRDPMFHDFFSNINQKMSFKIVKNKFKILNGTAYITARVRYIDGSDIYSNMISEFLRQIVSTAFYDESLNEEEIQQMLADILKKQTDVLTESYAEKDILYPVIKENNRWKVLSLDEETVKVLSVNFSSTQDQIATSIDEAKGGVDAAPVAQADSKIDMTTDNFSIHYTHHRISKDLSGQPCVMLYYDYTNNGSAASSAMIDVQISVYQNQTPCEATIPAESDVAIDYHMTNIEPGQTVNVCQVFSLHDTSDITVQASDAFNFGGGQVTTQLLKAQ